MYEIGCARICEFTYGPTKESSENRGWGLGETEHDCASPRSAHRPWRCARIVLSCGQGGEQFGGRAPTVGKWRERFREFGLDGLMSRESAHRARLPISKLKTSLRDTGIDGNQRTRSQHAPDGRRSGPDAECPSYSGATPESADCAIVLCVDEKSQVQALNRSQPILPLAPGVPARQLQDYERHGGTSLICGHGYRGHGSGSANFL